MLTASNPQILRVVEIEKTADIRRPHVRQLLVPNLRFPLPHRYGPYVYSTAWPFTDVVLPSQTESSRADRSSWPTDHRPSIKRLSFEGRLVGSRYEREECVQECHRDGRGDQSCRETAAKEFSVTKSVSLSRLLVPVRSPSDGCPWYTVHSQHAAHATRN